MKDEFVLFLCGGRWQVPWISFLKNKGHKIILVDPNDNSWCSIYADIFLKSDVKDVDSIIQFIKSNQYKIELVTSEQTDVSTIPVAILSAYFKTRHISLKTVTKFTDKYTSRLHASTISTSHIPKFEKITSGQEILTFSKNISKSFIVKPSDSQSSRGITILNKECELSDATEAFNSAIKYSSNNYVIAEEYVLGTEITIECIIVNGHQHFLTASRKKHFRTGIASELAYPLIVESNFFRKILEFHNKVVESTEMNFGITHSEYIIDESTEDFWLLEMACRGGGSLIPSSITSWVTGIDVYELHYNQLFNNTEKVTIPTLLNPPRTAVLHFLEFPSGKVISIEGIEMCKNLEGVEIIDLEFKIGDYIYPASDDRGRQGFVIVLVDSIEQAQQVISKIYNLIKITVA